MSDLYPLRKLAQQLTERPSDVRMSREEEENRRSCKVKEWATCYVKMVNREINVGSRRPTSFPEWVTLKVLAGGFPSGEAVAILHPNDVDNSFFLTEDGALLLHEMMDTGCFRVELPEHCALMVFAWLLRQGLTSEADAIVQEIGPSRLLDFILTSVILQWIFPRLYPFALPEK